MKKPTNIINTPPADTESWGSYNSETKQWSEKVYSGKAIREWIQNTIQSIKELLNTKLNIEDYNTTRGQDQSVISEQISSKVGIEEYNQQVTQIEQELQDKTGTQVSITYPTNFVIETDENESSAQERLKNVKYEVKNSKGEKLFEFWAMAQKYTQKQIVTYPNVWFISSNESLSNSNINNQILNTTPKSTSNSYSNTFDTTNYYVVVESGHSLVKVSNSQGFEYTNQFNTTDITISGYNVYHYSRVIGAPVTWTFTIN